MALLNGYLRAPNDAMLANAIILAGNSVFSTDTGGRYLFNLGAGSFEVQVSYEGVTATLGNITVSLDTAETTLDALLYAENDKETVKATLQRLQDAGGEAMLPDVLNISERSLLLPEGESFSSSLPAKEQRKGMALVFDAEGDPSIMVPASGSAADVLLQLAADGGVAKVKGAVDASKNLDDLADKDEAREKLGAASATEVDAALSQRVVVDTLAAVDGPKLVGRCSDVTALRAVEPTAAGQKIDVVAYYPGWAAQLSPVGGGNFVYDAADTTSADDGISCITTPGGKRWKRYFVNDQVSVFDGGIRNTTDDQATILQALVYYCAANNKKLIGVRYISVYCATGIVIPPTLTVDWCGMTIQQHSSMTTGVLVTLAKGTMTAPTTYRRGLPVDGIRIRGKYHATLSNTPDFTNEVSGLSIGGAGLQTSDIRVTDMEVKGFKKCVVLAGPSTYLWTFINCQIGVCWYRAISYEATSDSGENIRFIAGSVFNCINTTFDAVGFGNESTSSTLDILFMGTSFDYNDIDGKLVHSRAVLVDCHCENNNNNPKWILDSTSGSAKTKFLARGGSMGRGPGLPGTGIAAEDADGRPSFIDLIGSNIDVAIEDVDFGDYYTTARKSVVVRNVNNLAQRRIKVQPLMDGSANAGSGIPITPYHGINALYVPASGATTYWTLNPGSGTSVTADTTVSSPRDTGSRKVASGGSSTGGSIVQTIPVKPGQTVICKVAIKTIGLTSGSATGRVLFYAQDSTTLIQDTIFPRKITADAADLADVSWYGQVPSGAYFMRYQDYWTGIPLAAVSIWFSGEYAFPY